MLFKFYLFAVCLAGLTQAWSNEMEVDGMFEGDIQVSPEQMDRLQKGANEFGSIIGRRWPGGRIPYRIESSIGSTGRQQINLALNDYHSKTCLRFVQRTNERNYISFYAGQGCHSPVGMSGVNRISLGQGCQSKGTILHEIGHSIGMLHEQSRPDRDQYVTIHLGNLQNSRMAFNFQKASNINSLGTPYDLNSMMHYSSTAFARRGLKSITTKDRSKQRLIDTYNRISGFSPIDIKQINLMYKEECGNGGGGGGGGSGGNTGCVDKNGNCGSWARGGYCSNPTNAPWMKENCCKSCSKGDCVDKNTNCSGWARGGYCNNPQNASWMKANCCKSCS